MPPKPKAAPKKKDAEAQPQDQPPPQTLNERSSSLYSQSYPYAASLDVSGPSGLPEIERDAWITASFARSPTHLKTLGAKVQRDVWKVVNESSLPLRVLKKQENSATSFKQGQQRSSFGWGHDKYGADLGECTLEQYSRRSETLVQLTALEVQHTSFLEKKERERGHWIDIDTKEVVTVTADEVEEERLRRKEIASLRMDLYGERSGPFSQDPEWDDVVPMPIEEPEGALAAIAYPEQYAEAISYLRAVMATNEYSGRCLRLTEHIISMNAAHYTVWLYRFAILSALNIPILDEIEWLNQVSLQNLKNYQIWHHRRLLLDYYYPQISSSPEKIASLAKAEQEFLGTMLAEDNKNYHVWSYRQYLVPKLGVFESGELEAMEAFIVDDVRNNSAWSHRFFIVFSDPKHSTPDSLSTEHDPKVPADIIDREVKYAQDKILLAPQNQSPWNYMKGVLVKGGRKMGSVEAFAVQFVKDLGDEEKEDVKSSHALELLTTIYSENGDKGKAGLCLTRLGEKWDRIRVGYWEWKRQMLKDEKVAA